MDDVAVGVGEHLDLDVAGPLQIAFDQHPVVGKRRCRLLPSRGQRRGEVGRRGYYAHAAAATAGDRLDHDGKADPRCLVCQKLGILAVAVVAGQQRHRRCFHQRLGGGFRSHGAHRAGWWADEDDPRRGAGFGEGRIFRQEAVAGMNRLGAGGAGSFDDAGNVQIAVARRGRPDRVGSVRGLDVQRVGVGFGIDRDRLDPQPSGGPDDAAGDFASVGNQQGAEHRGHIRNTPKRVSCRGLFRAADNESPSTRRVSAGSMMPSSHRRALA